MTSEKRSEACEWIADAIEVIRQYQAYAEEMRAIGRGFYPSGTLGHTVDGVVCGLQATARDISAN